MAIPEQQLATQQAAVHQFEGVVKVDAGQIESARVNLAYTRIAEPITGRVGLRLVDVGNIVHAAGPTGLFVITRMDLISVIFTIPEDQLQVVLTKAAARQTLEADPLRELHPPDHLISSLPAASVGALQALLLTGHDLGIIAIIGIILLIGIVKKNAIVMIDFALAAERTEGKNSYDSIVEASLLRFRLILMTTMAALLGAPPLALGTGTGSELRRPLGITIIGGLIASHLLTLYTTPVVYLYLDGVQQWLARRRRASRDRV